MYKKTEFITSIQQSGDNEAKPLFFAADPSPARTIRFTIDIEGSEDGSPGNKLLRTIRGPYVSDGSNFAPAASENVDAADSLGSVNWQVNLIEDGSTGPITFGLHAFYLSGGPYTVNWTIKLIAEEFD